MGIHNIHHIIEEETFKMGDEDMGKQPTHAADVPANTQEQLDAQAGELAAQNTEHLSRTAGDTVGEDPPEGYEPQVEAGPQEPGVYEGQGDLVSDADAEGDEGASEESGDADNNDDNAKDDEPKPSEG